MQGYQHIKPSDDWTKRNRKSKPHFNQTKSMKSKILIAAIALIALTGSLTAQTNAPSPSIFPTNAAPSVFGPIETALHFLSQGSNWAVAPYALYDSGTKSYGGGLAAVIHTSDYIYPVLRLDYLDKQHTLYMPSGSATFQLPINVGPLTFLPFGFIGIAIPVAGHGTGNGEFTPIIGAGLAVRIPTENKPWYIPRDIVFDWEHWQGFSGDQWRFGAVFKFGKW
jgi:hypothetical protein